MYMRENINDTNGFGTLYMSCNSLMIAWAQLPHIDIPAFPGVTVKQVYDYLHRNHRHPFRFVNGAGGRMWCM